MLDQPTPETMETAQIAFDCFARGLATGEWDSFLALLTDDFSFWFPAGPFRGLNRGKARAAEFFQAVSRIFSEGLEIQLERTFYSETTVLFEVRSQGKMFGQPYENQAAISFDIRSDRVCGYREYLGVIFQVGQTS